jgi:hypothetical protein
MSTQVSLGHQSVDGCGAGAGRGVTVGTPKW